MSEQPRVDTEAIRKRLAAVVAARTALQCAEDSDTFEFPLSAERAYRLEQAFEDALDDLQAVAEPDIAALLEENAELRARLTLTPERIEAAAKDGYETWDDEWWAELTDSWQDDWRKVARAALLAAGMEEVTP